MAIFTQRATGTGAIATTVAPSSGPWELLGIRLHLSSGATQETFTATIDSAAGAVYDFLILSQAMSGVADVIQTFDPPPIFNEGDELDIAWTNSDGRTFGLEVTWRY